MMVRHDSAFDRLERTPQSERAQYRNVFEDQQIERTRIERPATMASRIVLTAIVALLVGVIAWLGCAAACYGIHRLSTLNQEDPALEAVALVTSNEIDVDHPDDPANWTMRVQRMDAQEGVSWRYQAVDAAGNPIGGEYESMEDVPRPAWVGQALDAYQTALDDPGIAARRAQWARESSFAYWAGWHAPNLVAALIGMLLVVSILYPKLYLTLQAQNQMKTTKDINQYAGDQHIAVPEEIAATYDFFPDAGAHSSVCPTTLLSHMMLTNKGVHEKAGDPDPRTGQRAPKSEVFDQGFADQLFDASQVPDDPAMRRRFDPGRLPYHGSVKIEGKPLATLGDLVDQDWHFPSYETRRPAGAYIVDTSPANTMVVAITRAGKGQTIIEPSIDMWLREDDPGNIVINDPKGELMKKFYVPATIRGYQVVQYNLINPVHTDIYNPLAMAAQAVREGNYTSAAAYVTNIAEVFFPVDGGDDPVWPNAANNAFKRCVYGLIDYYMEEENELRARAVDEGTGDAELNRMVDELWGHVTLYNAYQMFTRMVSKRVVNPMEEFRARMDAHEFDGYDQETVEQLQAQAAEQAQPWEGRAEADMLTVYFNATRMLPRNQIRTLVSNADEAVRSMGSAEKMMSSVYAIALNAMSFFTDPTISTLTSGTLSQNVDLASLSFPRRLGFQLDADFLARYHMVDMQCHWTTYRNPDYTDPYEGEDFTHDDLVTRAGWCRYYFKGIYDQDDVYPSCTVTDPATGMAVRTFRFRFHKTHQKTLDGYAYQADPVTGEKIVADGILAERVQDQDGQWVDGHVTFRAKQVQANMDGEWEARAVRRPAIRQVMAKYCEKPKVIFLVTPPHLVKYASIILILLKQLVDLNFDQSYMAKASQKPLYRTRYMLDELGNLSSDGHGIPGFSTMLSIGLGQDQQFTLILQTLQQLRDLYGDTVDKTVQGNTPNIVFLKSTDDSMIDTFVKMSGTTHRAYVNAKTITKDSEKPLLATEGKISYTMNTLEEPVLKYNDFAFIAPRNSIVFPGTNPPIWNRNETILPMSWRLLDGQVGVAGHEYTFQTLPTLSSAKEFDVRKNQPDFQAMFDKRIGQALQAAAAAESYQEAMGYRDVQVARLDPDVYADEVMSMVNVMLALQADPYHCDPVDDEQAVQAVQDAQDRSREQARARWAGHVSVGMLINPDFTATHGLDLQLGRAFADTRTAMEQDPLFQGASDGSLLLAQTGEALFEPSTSRARDAADANRMAADSQARAWADGQLAEEDMGPAFTPTDLCYQWLSGQGSWDFAGGRFEAALRRILDAEYE